MTPENIDKKLEFSACILAGNDRAANLRLLEQIFKKRGHKIILVEKGEFIVSSALAEPPDLILLDITIPGVDESEICSQLKDNPKTQNIPIIFLSAKEEVFDKVKSFAAGAIDYITQPFDAEKAALYIEKQLKIWRLSQELREQNNLLQEELQQLQENGNPLDVEELRQRINKRLGLLSEANHRWQQEIAARETQLRERSQLERELAEQNARRILAEKTASRREREFGALVENAPELILRLDRQCRYLYVNPKFAREAGKSAAEITGKTIRELEANQESIALWEKAVGDVFETGSEIAMEFETSSKGGVKYYFARVVPEWSEGAGVESVLAVVRDLGVRKRTEAKIRLLLRASQAINDAADVDSALAAILDLICRAIDWDWGEAWKLSRNGTALKFSGVCYRKDSSLAKFQESSEGITFAPGEGIPGRVWSKGKSEWLEGLDTLDEGVFRRQRAAAAVGLKTGLGVPVIADGRVVGVLVFFKRAPLPKDRQQLTELVEAIASQLGGTIETKQAQQALMLGEERLQLAVEASELGIWDWNIETGETYYSFQWKKMLGYQDEEIQNSYKSWGKLVHLEDLPEARRAISACLQGEAQTYEAEFRMRSRSGEWKWILTRGKLVEWNPQGKPLRMAGTNKDISDRKKAEMALAAQFRREKLVGVIQERIRSSLNLEEILTTAAEEIRKFLESDRVLIYRKMPQSSRIPIVESVASGVNGIAEIVFPEEAFPAESSESYGRGEVFVVEELDKTQVSPNQNEFLRQSGIKALLRIPILKDRKLWGLIAVHQCRGAREWQSVEIESLKQISVQLAIAIKQSTLYEQAQAEIWERAAAEKALRESQRFVQQIADTSPNLLYIFDLENQCNIYANRELAQLLGYTPETIREMGDRLLVTVIHPEDFAKLPEHFPQLYAAEDNKIIELEYRVKNAKGEWRYLLGRETIFARTPEGKAKQILGTASDITALKQIEAALREAVEREKTLAVAFERIRRSLDLDTIFTSATEELRFALECERVSIYRFDADYSGEFVAHSVAAAEWAIALKEGNSGRSLRSEPNQSCRLDTLVKFPQKWHDSYLQESKGSHFKLADTYSLVVEDIYRANFSGCYLERLEELNIKAYIIVPIFCGSKLWGLLAAYECSRPRSWKTTDQKIAAEIGNQLGVAIQQAELLKQTKKQSESLERAALAADGANRAKSEFLASMSHELRTPLNAILGFTQLMNRDRSLSPENQERLKTIDRAGEHLLALINDILEMSKIEAGRTVLHESCFNLTSMLENLESMLELKAKSKGLELIFDIAPELPPVIEGDERKLRQVLINILGNAIKFTKQGRVSLRATVTASEPPNFQLQFDIEDTGPGIAPKEMDRLFEPFGQTKTGRESQQGTGLGLPISRKFVQMMGGDIRVSSALNKGSAFSFDIRVVGTDVRDFGDECRHKRAIALADPAKKYRILAADDLANNRQFLVALLTAIGFEVREAENGEAALKLRSSWQPHLILMDMRMPVMDGYEATKRIKATDRGKSTVVIALTASAFEEDRQKIFAAGCDDFLGKPFREEVLLEKIAKNLGIKYIYEEDDEPSQEANKTPEKVCTSSDIVEYLSQMPEDWVARVRHAASQGTDEVILELLEQVPVQLAPLSSALGDLANNYQFEAIMELTKKD